MSVCAMEKEKQKVISASRFQLQSACCISFGISCCCLPPKSGQEERKMDLQLVATGGNSEAKKFLMRT